MFKDKELHTAIALLINRFADFCIAYNQSTKTISTNFQYIGDQLVAFEDKLTNIQSIQDKLDNQSHTLIGIVDERNRYQRLLEDTQEELQQVGIQLADGKLHNIELLTEIESLRHKLVMSQSEANLAASATVKQPAQPVQPAGFNIQELANELSKYLTAPTVVDDTGLPTTRFNNPNPIQNFVPPAPSTGMGQDYNAPDMSPTPIRNAALGDSVGIAASVLQPRSYIPSPSTSEPDAIFADNILAADPEVMARIPKTPGPVLLPSQAQYAYQVAELVAEGAQYLPPVPTAPTQG